MHQSNRAVTWQPARLSELSTPQSWQHSLAAAERKNFQAVSKRAADGSTESCNVLLCFLPIPRGLEAIAAAGIRLPSSMCLKRGSVVRFRGTQMFSTEASPYSHSVNR